MSTYTRAASHCDQRWTCVLWNQGVKWSWCGQASSQPAPKWTKANQPNRLTNQQKTKKRKITKQLTRQPISSPTSKYRNQLLKQNKSTNALWINILLVCHFRIKQSSKSKQKHDKNDITTFSNWWTRESTIRKNDSPNPPTAAKHSVSDIRAWATEPRSSWTESHSAGMGYCWQ